MFTSTVARHEGPALTIRFRQTATGGRLGGHGWYVSAVPVTPALANPPAMRIRPSGSSAAAAMYRGVLRPVSGDHRPVSGSKVSAQSTNPASPTPPATTTRPSASRIVSKKYRGTWAMAEV